LNAQLTQTKNGSSERFLGSCEFTLKNLMANNKGMKGTAKYLQYKKNQRIWISSCSLTIYNITSHN